MKLFTILEDIYGRYATVYHRTSVEDLVNRIYDSGFKPGDGKMYGKGFYATYDLESQEENKMTEVYGNVLVKFQVILHEFFIFDYDEFIKSPLGRQLKYTKEDFIFKQLDYFKIRYKKDDLQELIDKSVFSSDIAYSFTNDIDDFKRKVNGIIFTGRRDKKVLACFKPNKLIIPISYKIDNTDKWIKADKNLDYLKKVFNSSNDPIDGNNENDIDEYKDGLTYEILKKKFSWLLQKNVIIENAILGYKDNTLIWYSGNWGKGTWEDGIWENGTFRGTGIWKDGTFKDGIFYGLWEGGDFQASTNNFGGIWNDNNNLKPGSIIEFKDGLTYNIIKEKFPWMIKNVSIIDAILGYENKKIIWYGGTWIRGTWKDGVWKGGRFHTNAIWEDGIFEDGRFYGKWYGGEWLSNPNNFNGEWLDSNTPKPEKQKEKEKDFSFKSLLNKYFKN